MRISIDELLGVHPRPLYKVLLNDIEVEQCTMADEEQGIVEHYVPRSEVPEGAENWPVAQKRGKVTIICLKD